jgi:hypothetical protein
VNQESKILLRQGRLGAVMAKLRAEHARGSSGSIGIVRHVIGILSTKRRPQVGDKRASGPILFTNVAFSGRAVKYKYDLSGRGIVAVVAG